MNKLDVIKLTSYLLVCDCYASFASRCVCCVDNTTVWLKWTRSCLKHSRCIIV